MTRIVIDDINNVEDLLTALAAVHAAFATGHADFDYQQEYFSQNPERAGERLQPLPPLRPGEVRQVIPDQPRPTPYVPCLLRGSHLRLADCWLCWSDVQRRACAQVDVLSPEAWDLALVGLTQGHVTDVPLQGLPAPGADADEV